MNKPFIYLLILISTLTFLQCTNQEKKDTSKRYNKPDNPYLIRYSGGYTIEVKGLRNTGDVELYVLSDNGKAQWMYLKTLGRKEPEIITRKYGT